MIRNRWWLVIHPEKKAEDFLSALTPGHGLLDTSYLPGSWLYRGTGNANYELFPSAFRENAAFVNQALRKHGPAQTVTEQIRFELGTLRAFIDAADRQGHAVPEDSHALRHELMILDRHLSDLEIRKYNSDQEEKPTQEDRIQVWPHPMFFAALGLAQHYGVSTRLLNWTLNPFVAVYFAAVSALQRPGSSSMLCVWALLRDILDFEYRFSPDETVVNPRLPIKLAFAPAAHNPNLRAQHAVFLVYQHFDLMPGIPFRAQPYDDLLVENLEFFRDVKAPVLFQFTLPVSEVGHLLRLLATRGIDGGAVFPGLEGAAKVVQERLYWSEDAPDVRPAHYKERMRKYLAESRTQNIDKEENS